MTISPLIDLAAMKARQVPPAGARVKRGNAASGSSDDAASGGYGYGPEA